MSEGLTLQSWLPWNLELSMEMRVAHQPASVSGGLGSKLCTATTPSPLSFDRVFPCFHEAGWPMSSRDTPPHPICLNTGVPGTFCHTWFLTLIPGT